MFVSTSGNGAPQVNCAVQPETDVSGIGIRYAFYLQAAFSIFLNCGTRFPTDVYLTNMPVLLSLICVVGSTLFYSSIDIVHALLASHFAVMLANNKNPVVQLAHCPALQKGG